jgi:RNA polymerase sigma factor (sigma-70 family)
MADSDPGSGRPKGSFATTQWSLVVAAGEANSPEARLALEALCRDYWRPIYVYLRRRGADHDRASDETQGFFSKLIEKNYVGDARRERGRFRTFLLTSLKHYLANEWDRESTQKRGGGRLAIPIDTREGEAAYELEAASDERPDRLFERRWARSVLDVALHRLRDEAKASGTLPRFDALLPFLAGGAGRSYREVADRLEMTEAAARIAVHRTRRRFRAVLRSEVARIVEDPAQVDDELRYLASALGTLDAV